MTCSAGRHRPRAASEDRSDTTFPPEPAGVPSGSLGGSLRTAAPHLCLFKYVSFFSINENHVHIGAIIKFLAAQFAETNHASGRPLPLTIGVLMPRLSVTCNQLQAT